MIKFVVLFVATLVSVHGYGIPYSNWPPQSPHPISYGPYNDPRLAPSPGVDTITQPILQTVLLRQPAYGNNLELQRLLAQALAARDAEEQGVREDASNDRSDPIKPKDDSSVEDSSRGKDRRRDDDEGSAENQRPSDDRRSSRRISDNRRSDEESGSSKKRRSDKKQDSSEDRGSSDIRRGSKDRDSQKDLKSRKDDGSGEERRSKKVRSSKKGSSSAEENDSPDDRNTSVEKSGISDSERSRLESIAALTARQSGDLGNVAPVCILFGNYGP